MTVTPSTLPTGAADECRSGRIERLLKGAIDLHCHSGPSVMPRDIDHIEAVRACAAAGMRAVLFKDHYYSAAPIVRLLDVHYGHLGVKMLSGVPLNNASGGFNAYAVEHGLALGARMVWMPTFSAANHIRHERHGKVLPLAVELMPPRMLTVIDDGGRIKDEVKIILDQIAAADVVLSGGHLHVSEIFLLFDEAERRGVTRRLVNHPTFVIGASIADVRDLAASGAYIEHSMCQFAPTSRFLKFSPQLLSELIDAATVGQTILGSDLGQVGNPTLVDGFREVIGLCLDLGLDDAEVGSLVGGNAARLIGLDVEHGDRA